MILRLASGTTFRVSIGFGTRPGVRQKTFQSLILILMGRSLNQKSFCIMIAFAGMGGLLFSYGGFDHKNPSCSQIH